MTSSETMTPTPDEPERGSADTGPELKPKRDRRAPGSSYDPDVDDERLLPSNDDASGESRIGKAGI